MWANSTYSPLGLRCVNIILNDRGSKPAVPASFDLSEVEGALASLNGSPGLSFRRRSLKC